MPASDVQHLGMAVLVRVAVVPRRGLDERDVVAVAVGEHLGAGVTAGAPWRPLECRDGSDVPAGQVVGLCFDGHLILRSINVSIGNLLRREVVNGNTRRVRASRRTP